MLDGCLVLGRHALQVDEVWQHVGHEENVTRLLHGFKARETEGRQFVSCLDKVDAGTPICKYFYQILKYFSSQQ